MIRRLTMTLTPLVLSLGLAGCLNLAPDYQRPALPVPATLPAATSAAPAALPGWRELVRDERLRQVVNRALTQNRDLRVAVLNVERSRAQLRITDADRWPSLSVGLTGQRAPNSSGNEANTFTGGLQLASYELDLFGRLRNNSDAASATLLGNVAAARSARLSLVTATATAWLTLAADEEQLRLAQRTLATRDETLRLVRLQAEVGAASELDLRGVQTLSAQARATVAQLQRQRDADLNALNLLVGEALPAELLPGAMAATDAHWLSDVPAFASSELLLGRPDLMQAEQSLVAANANIGAARAALFPAITLSGSYGVVSDSLSGLIHDGITASTISGSVLLSIFDAGRRQANVKVAEVNRDIAVAQYEKAVQTAFSEAATALQGQAQWRTQVQAQSGLLEAERERYRLTKLKYDVGAASQLDYLDIERSLASAEQALVQVRLGELLNRLSLYKALGGEERGAPLSAEAPASAAEPS